MNDSYYSPGEITEKFLETGVQKAGLPIWKQLVLGVMAGMFIALASQASSQAIHTINSSGVAKTVSGALFAGGLMMVAVAGGELFTGNCLMIVACFRKKITVGAMLRSWAVVYLGNLMGALLVVLLIAFSGQLGFSGGLLGAFTVKTAAYKANLSFGNAFCLGVLCNILVCAAVWMAAAARDITGKILAIFFPVWLFVASGFEHSVANMYYIPAGILAKANDTWAALAADMGTPPGQLAALNVRNFLLGNLLPVTLGNIAGGAVLVGLAYGFVYLRLPRGE